MTPAGAGSPYTWSFDPSVLLVVAIVGLAYGMRFRDLRRESGERAGSRPSYLRALSFGAGLAVLVLALESPIESLGEERLFTVHMAQHLLLSDIVPILLLLGLSRQILRPATRRLIAVERVLGPLANPITALVALVVVVCAWHIPALYELALEDRWAHSLEHLSFLIVGTVFWWYVIEPLPPRRPLRGMGALGYMAGAKLLLGSLGVVLAFSPSAIYDTYEQAPRTWGLSPTEDLNIGGLLMMLEQSIVLVVFFAILLARVLERSEEAERRRERFGL